MKIHRQAQVEEISVQETEQSLLQTLWLHNMLPEQAYCSGVGTCKKCKIRFLSSTPEPTADEKKLFSEIELATGMRLSCKHNAKTNFEIELIENTSFFYDKKSSFTNIEEKKASIVCDFGTTSVEYQVKTANTVLYSEKALNPLSGTGSEVMARLSFALKEGTAMHIKVVHWLLSQVEKAKNQGIEVEKIIFAANTAMTLIALNKPVESLAYAPYTLTYKGGEKEIIADYKNLPPLFIPPLWAPFIGGDVSAGIYYLEKKEKTQFPYLFVDMGTNAEFVLALDKNTYFISSVPLGPALEGVGLTFGNVATNSCINQYQVSPQGIVGKTIEENLKPTDICGAGYLSLISSLIKAGMMSTQGKFNPEPHLPFAKKASNYFSLSNMLCLKLPYDFYLSPLDVEALLKVKAAFASALLLLLKQGKISPKNLNALYLAGALGQYIDKNILAHLGFMPSTLVDKTIVLGNTSLKGAELLQNPQDWDNLLGQKEKHIHLELAHHPEFFQTFLQNYNFNPLN